MRSRRSRCLTATAFAFSVLCGTASAAGPWHRTATDFRTMDGFRGSLALDVAPNGRAVMAWPARSGAIRVAFSRRGGSFGRASTVPGSYRASALQVAIDAAGNAVVAWVRQRPTRTSRCCLRVQAATRWAGGRLGSAQPLSVEGADIHEFRLALDPGGAVGVAWQEGGFAQASFAGFGGRFGGPVNASHYEDATRPRICFDGVGRVAVAWAASDSYTGDGSHLALADGVVAGPFGSSYVVSDGSEFGSGAEYDWQLGCGPRGQSAMWATGGYGINTILGAVRRRGEAFRVQTLESRTGVGLYYPFLATSPNGRAIATWLRGPSNQAHTGVRAAVGGTHGTFGDPRRVPGSGGNRFPITSVDAAIDDRGRSVATWPAARRTFAALGSPAGRFAKARLLGSSSGEPATGAGGGVALVAWVRSGRIRLAFAVLD